jgi:hypothetical protein
MMLIVSATDLKEFAMGLFEARKKSLTKRGSTYLHLKNAISNLSFCIGLKTGFLQKVKLVLILP